MIFVQVSHGNRFRVQRLVFARKYKLNYLKHVKTSKLPTYNGGPQVMRRISVFFVHVIFFYFRDRAHKKKKKRTYYTCSCNQIAFFLFRRIHTTSTEFYRAEKSYLSTRRFGVELSISDNSRFRWKVRFNRWIRLYIVFCLNREIDDNGLSRQSLS